MSGEGPPLRLATPFGRAFVRAPAYLRRALLKQRLAPVQSDGELLLEMCYSPEDNAPLGAATFKHMMLREDLMGWTLADVVCSDHFNWLVTLTDPGGGHPSSRWKTGGHRKIEIIGPYTAWPRLASQVQSRSGDTGSPDSYKILTPSLKDNWRKNFDSNGPKGWCPSSHPSRTRYPTWPRSWVQTKRGNGWTFWVTRGSGHYGYGSIVLHWKTFKQRASHRSLGPNQMCGSTSTG